MKKLLTLWMLSLLPFCISAQTDAKAAEVLDKALTCLSDNNGVRIVFEGSENGFLLLKGEKFYLNNGNIQSWYDGKVQWSYVADTEEVNISNPTSEELRGINPYLILKNYKTDYNYAYQGQVTRKGVKGHDIVLTPKQANNPTSVSVFITKTFQPLSMKIEQNGQTVSDINVTSFQNNQHLEDGMFRFNKSLYPNAEVIDMR